MKITIKTKNVEICLDSPPAINSDLLSSTAVDGDLLTSKDGAARVKEIIRIAAEEVLKLEAKFDERI